MLWVGYGFQNAYVVVLLLSATGLITYSQQIAYTSLMVANKLTYRAITLFIGAVISVSVSITLVPYFGAIGASAGICIGLLFSEIAMNIFFHRVLDLDVLAFFSECHLKMLPSFLLALGVGFLVSKYVPADSLLTFMPKAALLGVLYSMIMWVLVMNSYEKQLVLSGVRRFPGLGSRFE